MTVEDKIKILPTYNRVEEKINVVTHAVGAAIGIASAVAMLVLAIIDGATTKIVGSLIFGFGLIWLYTMSTMYHNEKDMAKRVIRQKMDHLSINILIASSNTFFMVAALANGIGYLMTAIVWALSITAMILNIINVKKFRAVTMTIYILTGWMPIFIMHILYGIIGLGGVMWLLAGGLFYTFGTIFYGVKKPYTHAIWHFMVLFGSISHIICAVCYVLL